MTVKIERDALNCITNGTPRDLHHDQKSSANTCLSLNYSSPPETVKILGTETSRDVVVEESSYPELDMTDDDSSVSSYSIQPGRRVTFHSELITEVRTRPKTSKKDVRKLFYSYEETQQFRQEYRFERKRLAEEDESTFNFTMMQDCNMSSQDDSFPNMGFRISRVVVVHKDFQETFIDKCLNFNIAKVVSDESPSSDDSEFSFASGSFVQERALASSVTKPNLLTRCKMASDDFFDNENFWSGQITWY